MSGVEAGSSQGKHGTARGVDRVCEIEEGGQLELSILSAAAIQSDARAGAEITLCDHASL
jgi:hypothetical protein